MPFDPVIAERLRASLAGVDGVVEKKMFGGIGFLLQGNMAVAASSDGGVMVRSAPEQADELLDGDAIVEMQMRGRTMAGWLHAEPRAVATDEQLQRIVDHGLRAAAALPPK